MLSLTMLWCSLVICYSPACRAARATSHLRASVTYARSSRPVLTCPYVCLRLPCRVSSQTSWPRSRTASPPSCCQQQQHRQQQQSNCWATALPQQQQHSTGTFRSRHRCCLPLLLGVRLEGRLRRLAAVPLLLLMQRCLSPRHCRYGGGIVKGLVRVRGWASLCG